MGSESQRAILLTLFLREDAFMLSGGVLDTLHRPEYIQVLVNHEKKRMIIQSCGIEDRFAIVIPEETTESFLTSGTTLLRNLKKDMGWQDTSTRILAGEVIPGREAVLFDLEQARVITTTSQEPKQQEITQTNPNLRT